MQRVILTTGGTGGHIFPALAVAEEIRRVWPEAEILFMGGQYGPEADLAIKAGLDFTGLPVRGVMGRGLKGFGAALGMAGALGKALGLIRAFRPDLVIGFGGYAAFAGVLAGRLAGARTALHEQNSFPGMANRLLGKIVDRVFLSMPDVGRAFPADTCLLVGNPVRSGIVALYEERKVRPAGKDHTPFRLLVMGGSQGARALNEAMIAIMPRLLEAGVEIRHQTGGAEYERVRAAYQKFGKEPGVERVRVLPFIDDMPAAYAWADLVFCRAGATSMAEITAAGLPAVLTPFPQAAQDHQRHNARYLADAGAALILEQEEVLRDPDFLLQSIRSLMDDRPRLAAMAKRSLDLARPHAAAALVREAENLTHPLAFGRESS